MKRKKIPARKMSAADLNVMNETELNSRIKLCCLLFVFFTWLMPAKKNKALKIPGTTKSLTFLDVDHLFKKRIAE